MLFPHPLNSRWFGKPRKHAFYFSQNVELGGILQHYLLQVARFMYVNVYMLQETDILFLNIL